MLSDAADDLPEASQYLRSKYRKLADPVSGPRLFELLRYELRVAEVDLRDRVVMDAGCGSGIFSVMFATLGARRIEAFDLFDDNIQALQALARRFNLPIRTHLGDAQACALEAASVDFIYCVEAISHFSDWQAFAREACRVLAPDGCLCIGDGNNGANPIIVRHVHDDWEASECGPFTAHRFPEGANSPYLFRRWMIIRRAFPGLLDDEVFQLGMRTAGLGGDALLEACRQFLQFQAWPDIGYRRGMSQRRPEDAQRNEEPLDPRRVAAYLDELGVPATVRPHFGHGRSRLLPALNEFAARMGPLALVAAPRYLVLARRP
jgi:SAM-dependent methyltransferase